MFRNSIAKSWYLLFIVLGFVTLSWFAFTTMPTAQESIVRTFVLNGNTNADGHFIIPHGIRTVGDAGQNYYRIYGMLVAIQHSNGAWNTIDTSHQYNNTFFWNDQRVEGWIGRPDKAFGNRSVRIVIFAELVVG